jgi:hypothetical protein
LIKKIYVTNEFIHITVQYKHEKLNNRLIHKGEDMKNKNIISILIIILGATSLVASYQHQLNAEQTSSVSMYESRRQIQGEIYYSQKVDGQPEQVELTTLDKSISVTPTPIIVGEREVVSVFPSDFDDKNVKEEDMKRYIKVEYTYKVTDEEREILERIVEAEAEGQSIEARENVCSNIIARVESLKFPNTIKEVVFQKNQYSSITNGRYDELKVSKKTKKAVNNILINGLSHECLYYFNVKDISSSRIKSWIDNDLVLEFKDDSGHSYYNEK